MPKPDAPIPAPDMILPVMRGFACSVQTPFMGQTQGPPEGIGCGWANVPGEGPQFFITMHAEGGFAMTAKLDYARWRRFAENWASAGQQAMITGHLDQTAPNDPLEALEVAMQALMTAKTVFTAYGDQHAEKARKAHGVEAGEREIKTTRNRQYASQMDAALKQVRAVLLLDDQPKDETHDQ